MDKMRIVRLLRCLPPQLPGRLRLAAFLLRPLFDLTGIKIEDRYGFSYNVPSIKESIGLHLLVFGIYEPLLMECLLHYIKPGFTFVDVGANIGTFSIPMAKAVGGGGIVLSVEPSPTVFPYLRDNVRLNNASNIKLENCAAGERDDFIQFYDAPISHFGMGSFGPQFGVDPVKVHVKTLDSILLKNKIKNEDIVKVDGEGYEALIFKGMPVLLNQMKKPIIFFEFCDWAEQRIAHNKTGDSQRVLRECGYKIYRLRNFIRGDRKPLVNILLKGSETLVAVNGL